MYGQSTVRKVELQSGKVKQSVALPTHDFGEGLVKLGDNLFQLLWRTGMIYKYSVAGGTINKIGGAQVCTLL
jgi:glutamine cyclotransferase